MISRPPVRMKPQYFLTMFVPSLSFEECVPALESSLFLCLIYQAIFLMFNSERKEFMDHKTSHKKITEGGRGSSLAKGWIRSNKSAFLSPASRELVTPNVGGMKLAV